MKPFLQAAAGIVALVAMAAVLLFAFGPIERSRGQTAAMAPTPTAVVRPIILTNLIITPTAQLQTPTPTPQGAPPPKPERPVVDPWVLDPNWGRAPEPTFPVRATPTPRPATGGPYISQARAIEIALGVASGHGVVDQGIPPRTLFTRAKEIPAILGTPNPTETSEREFWVVWVYGRFKSPNPGGESPIVFSQSLAIIDATTGQLATWGLDDGH